MNRHAPHHLLAAVLTLLLAKPASADMLPSEGRMAMDHVQAVIPGVLARHDEELRLAVEQAKRAHRGVIVPSQPEAVMIDGRGEYTYAGMNAMTDTIMSCEYAAAWWSRQLDLVEGGLCFEGLPESVDAWKPGVVGVLSISGAFEDPHDRTVRVLRIMGPHRMLVTATIAGIGKRPSGPFVIDGLATEGLRVGDNAPVGNEPFAVLSESEQARISRDSTERVPLLRLVRLDRYGAMIAAGGRRVAENYRRTNPRPSREPSI